MPKVTAIITTHNRSHLLPRAIESVINQTFKDFQLIVVDDASVDETPEIIQQYESKGSVLGIRIERSRGANHARNQGAEAATGEYLAYLDDDDFWFPNKLE
ncbi:MAG: glycosyltransferase family 2 protein, partial [Acidobacteria bacterium]|nr:glycosyltransferase family 2 protein [Acidobacteriota bacterium]